MQSPLTPQRGRIESNPREYTHMECRACDELEVMPPGSRCILAACSSRVDYRTDDRGYSDARGSRVENRTNERGYPDARRMRVDFRTKLASKRPKTVQ